MLLYYIRFGSADKRKNRSKNYRFGSFYRKNGQKSPKIQVFIGV